MLARGEFSGPKRAVDSMRNTVVRREKGKEGGRRPCLDGGSVGAGAFFSNCLRWCQGVSVKERVLAAMCSVCRMGATWDVFCILALTCVHYLVLQCIGQRWTC